MKRYILICLTLLGAGSTIAQKHVSDLVVTLSVGGAVIWYDAATNGNVIAGTETLATGNYYASQTVNGIESTARLAVAVTVSPASVAGSDPSNVTDATETANFTTTGGTGSIQWQVLIDAEAPWSNLTNTGVYTGATTGTLNISDVTDLDGYQYKAVFTSGTCASDDTLPATLYPAD